MSDHLTNGKSKANFMRLSDDVIYRCELSGDWRTLADAIRLAYSDMGELMQREAKLRDALEEMHALYAGTDRMLDPTEVCGKVQELLYCSEYRDNQEEGK